MMGYPQIVYNGVTLAFTRQVQSGVPTIQMDTTITMSSDGHHAAHHARHLWRCRIQLEKLTAAEEAALLNWWAYAGRGNYYAVALDSTKVANTTLDDAAASGQKTIPLTATTSIVAGDLLVIEKSTRAYYEIVVVDSVSAGISVTATVNLSSTFASGDTCRHFGYFPRAVSVDDKSPIDIDGAGSTNVRNFDHIFEEDLS